LDERVTYAASFYRPESTDNGVQFQQGDYAAIGRLTALPIWEADGRCFMHIGGSATWRHAQGGKVAFATEAGMRDRSGGDNGFGSPIAVGAATVANGGITGMKAAPGNATNWVTTGSIAAEGSTIFGAEFLYNRGPF